MEVLAAYRVAAFVEYVEDNDMQVLANRRRGKDLLTQLLVKRNENCHVVELGNDKYDKLMTYFSQNDLQVHQAGADSTVGIYSFVKIMAELRRALRKADEDGLSFHTQSPDGNLNPDRDEAASPSLARKGYSPAKLGPVAKTEARPGRSRVLFEPARTQSPPGLEGGEARLKGGRGGLTEGTSTPT